MMIYADAIDKKKERQGYHHVGFIGDIVHPCSTNSQRARMCPPNGHVRTPFLLQGKLFAIDGARSAFVTSAVKCYFAGFLSKEQFERKINDQVTCGNAPMLIKEVYDCDKYMLELVKDYP